MAKKKKTKKTKKKPNLRGPVKVNATKASDALLHRKHQLEQELQDLEQQIESSSDNNNSNNKNSNTNKSNKNNNNSKKENDEENASSESNSKSLSPQSTIIDDLFAKLEKDPKYDHEHFSVFEELHIDATQIIYMLQNNLSECMKIFSQLTNNKWTAGNTLGLKMLFDKQNKTTKIINDNNSNNNKSVKQHTIFTSDDSSDADSFEFDYDPKKPNLKQFEVLYTSPNEYKQMKPPGRINYGKAYYVAVELTNIMRARNEKIKKMKQAEKQKCKRIPLISLVTYTGTTLYYRKIDWFAMLFIYNYYVKIISKKATFNRDKRIKLLECELQKCYMKNKNKKSKFKFKPWTPKFVNDAFDTIGCGWLFISGCGTAQSQENKKRGRRKRKTSYRSDSTSTTSEHSKKRRKNKKQSAE
eukprot:89239_1